MSRVPSTWRATAIQTALLAAVALLVIALKP